MRWRWLGEGASTTSCRRGGEKSRAAARSRGERQSRGGASREKMTTSIHRWTTTADKGNLRCRTWGGGHRRRTVTVRGVTHAGGRPVRSVKRCLTLTSRPRFHYTVSMISNHPNLKFEKVTFLMSKIYQSLLVDRLRHREQLLFLEKL
jgi:hypothetical protein